MWGRPDEAIMCIDVPKLWVDEWRSGTFCQYSCKAAFWTQKHCQGYMMSSAQFFHGPYLWSVVQFTYLRFSGNVPLLHTSTQRPGTSLHVISFTWHSPTLVLQATNAGVGRPGYKARASERTSVRRVWWVTRPWHGSTAAFLPQCWWGKECHVDRPNL